MPKSSSLHQIVVVMCVALLSFIICATRVCKHFEASVQFFLLFMSALFEKHSAVCFDGLQHLSDSIAMTKATIVHLR